MPRSKHAHTRARSAPVAAVAGLMLVTLTATAALAVSGMRTHTTGATRVVAAGDVASLGKSVVVNVHGRTLYVLSPETARHLLCKSRACLETWPPLPVRSAHAKLTAGPGVGGRLGVIRRGAGRYQVTLRGLPLYRFAGDSAGGEANGNGIKSFGGTWHVVVLAAMAPAPQPPAPAPQPPPPHYGY